MGMACKDVPGIPEYLRGTIVRILTKGMVHPRKLTIDVRRIYDTLRMKRRGGVGGLLAIHISNAKGFFEDLNRSLKVFCECEFEKTTFRTPIRNGGHSVDWDWDCAVRLNEKISSDSHQAINIKIFNSTSVGDPSLLAHGSVSSPFVSKLHFVG